MAKQPWEDDPVEFWASDPIDEPVKKRGLKGKQIEDFLPTRESMGESIGALRGLGETAANLAVGAIGGTYGQIAGTLAGLMQQGVGTEAKQRATEAAAAKGMESFSSFAHPRTEQGKEYTGKVGEFINEVLIPLAPHMPFLEGAAAATRSARALKQAAKPIKQQPPPGGFAPDIPLTLDEALAQADKAPENQLAGPRLQTTLPWERDPIVEPASKRAKLQGELFPEETVEMPAKFNKKGEPIREAGTVQQPRPQTITVSPQGTAMVAPEQLAGYEQFGRTMETPEAPVAPPLRGQGDLFLTDEVTGPIATPFDAAARGALPETITENPALARRQMDLGFEIEQPLIDRRTGEAAGGYAPPELRPGTMFVDEAGRATTALPERMNIIESDIATLELAQRNAEAKVRELAAKEAVERGETGNLFADYVNQHRDYELFRDENGKPLSRTAFNETVDNLAKEKSTGYVRPENMDEAYSKYLSNFEGVQAGLFDQPTTALEMAQTLKNDATTRLVQRHPLVKAAERFLNQEQQFLDQLKQQGANAAQIADAVRDVAKAQARLEKTLSNVETGIRGGKTPTAVRKAPKEVVGKGGEVTYMYEGIGETIRRVGKLSNILGAALDNQFNPDALRNRNVDVTPGEAKAKFLPTQVREGLADYTMERRPAAEIAAEAIEKNIPDIPNTPVQDRVMSGALPKQLATNNPIVRKTHAAMKDAAHAATANIKEFIQDKKRGLPALFRQLSKKEVGDWWAARQILEGEGDLTPQRMREMGMNEKQIALNTRLNEALDFAFERYNAARALMGKGPVDRRVGYLAGQMSGDFRVAIYDKATKEYVGAVGSDIRGTAVGRVKKLLDANPQWEAGPVKQANRQKRDSRQKAFEDAVEMLMDENPNVKALMDAYDKILKDDAYNYMNAKKHSLQKKGTFGTEGFKRDVDNWTNAKEGMASQIRYLEKIMNWAEISKAVDEVRPLLTNDQLNMPNAKAWASDYIDRALGIQTSSIGHALDSVLEAVGGKFGVGPSAIDRGVGAAKGAVSKMLLGFFQPLYLAINFLQPLTSSPIANSFLRSRGLEGAHMGMLPKNIISGLKVMTDLHLGDLTPFEKQLRKEGERRNIFGSEFFDHSVHLRKAGYVGNKLAEVGIPQVEAATRGFIFTHFANVLERNKYKGRELFDIAENLTNEYMIDYHQFEAPAMYKEMGALGDMAVTLQRYKHGQLSMLTHLVREASRNKSYRPIATAIGTGLAFSGLTGMLGFQDADFAYQQISKAMGKPDTLTRLAMEHLPDTVNFGAISTLSGIDMSKRFGMTLFPEDTTAAMFPGSSKLLDVAGAAVDVAKNPTDATEWQRLARQAPGIAGKLADKAFFEREVTDEETGETKTYGVDPRTLESTVERTPRDKFAKIVGGVGLEESKTKTKLFQESKVDKAFMEKRQKISHKILNDLYQMDPKDTAAMKEYFHNGEGAQLKQDWIDAEGNIDNLVAAVEKFRKGGRTTAEQRKMLSVAAAQKEGDVKRAKRYKEMSEE